MCKYFTTITFLLFFQINALPQPYITVISPNGGEVWCGGTNQEITWEDNIPGNVEIQFFKSGVFHSTIVASTPSDGSYLWNIPGGSGDSDYLIRIVSVDDGNIFDFSDSTFTIGCYIKVISPNGGEVWCGGTTQNITWEDNITGNVEIQLFKAGVFHSSIVTSTPSDGSYSWNLPSGSGASDLLIRIVSVDDGNIFDFSDSTFTIGCYIKVISPNGGEVFCGASGKFQVITWEYNIPGSVAIEVYKDGVLNYTITASTPSDGEYTWNFPGGSGSSDYLIRIVSVADANIFDFSDSTFTIGCDINIISPNGGEIWQAGTTETIIWTGYHTENVTVDLYKGGVFHSVLLTTTASDTSQFWAIPSEMESGSDYRIKITSVDVPGVSDFSDSNFTILRTDSITVTSPNGGEVLCGGAANNITWEDNIPGNVEIQLFKAGVFHSSITTSTPSDGSYAWNIPGGSGASDLLIRIASVDDGNIFDFSDSTFTIGCGINIISPDGGETWLAGATETIIWTGDHTEDVTVDLYKGGVFHSVLITTTASDTSQFWDIPMSIQPRSDYTIKITSNDNPGILDFSDEDFTIAHLTSAQELINGIPESYQLMQNYPNPFNPSTTIYYALPESGNIELVIYDVLGNEVMKFTEEQSAGYHKFEFDGNDINSGVYFYRIQAGDFVQTKKMILIK